jgi:hypothetical protein
LSHDSSAVFAEHRVPAIIAGHLDVFIGEFDAATVRAFGFHAYSIGGFKERLRVSYSGLGFLLALGLCFGASGFAFGGRPGLGVLRIASRTSGAYMASLVRGLNPALWIRLSTVLGGSPKDWDISVKVNPSISLVSDYIKKILKKVVNFKQIILTYCLKYPTI